MMEGEWGEAPPATGARLSRRAQSQSLDTCSGGRGRQTSGPPRPLGPPAGGAILRPGPARPGPWMLAGGFSGGRSESEHKNSDSEHKNWAVGARWSGIQSGVPGH